MVNPTEATTAMLSRMALVIAVTYRLSAPPWKTEAASNKADGLISAAAMDLCPHVQGVLKSYGPPFFISR
jgi:hypothetical protein